MTETRLQGPVEPRRLSNGFYVWVDEKGRAELARCSWLVRRPTNNPEPDSIEDTYRDEDCGARLTVIATEEPAYGEPSWVCEAGHSYVAYTNGGAELEWEREQHERFEATGSVYG